MPLSWGCLFCPSCHLLSHHPISSNIVLSSLVASPSFFNHLLFFYVTVKLDRLTQLTMINKQGTNLQWLPCCQVMIFNYSQSNAHRHANKLSASFKLLKDSWGGTLAHHTRLWRPTSSSLISSFPMHFIFIFINAFNHNFPQQSQAHTNKLIKVFTSVVWPQWQYTALHESRSSRSLQSASCTLPATFLPVVSLYM